MCLPLLRAISCEYMVMDDFHPAVGLLTLFAAICLGLAISVRVLLLSYNISCFGHSSSVPKARRGVPSRYDVQSAHPFLQEIGTQ